MDCLKKHLRSKSKENKVLLGCITLNGLHFCAFIFFTRA